MKSMRADIEWLMRDAFCGVGCLRIGGDDFDHRRHDPYTRSCTVRASFGREVGGSDVIEVKGWCGPIDAAQWRAMEACFSRERFDQYAFERVTKSGKIRRHVTVLTGR